MTEQSETQQGNGAETVVVENHVGPMRGYYHDPENDTWMGDGTMSRQEAEKRGYTECGTCFGGNHD